MNQAHESAKTQKVLFLGGTKYMLTTGFTNTSTRQFKVWDYRTFKEPVNSVDVDNAAGVLNPFYDPDTSILYLAGKGDGNIRYYELTKKGKESHAINDHRTSSSTKVGIFILLASGLSVDDLIGWLYRVSACCLSVLTM